MIEYFLKLFDSSGFVARRDCGEWTNTLIVIHNFSDILIWLCYLTIPLLLIYFTRKVPSVPFQKMFWLFSFFIISCGMTHLMGFILFYKPMYYLDGLIKLITALASMLTVIHLIPVLPQALVMRFPEELEKEIKQKEIAQYELERINRNLERVVLDRTEELRQINEKLFQEVEERKKAELDLLRERSFLQAVLESVELHVVACDSSGKILLMNRQSRKLYGNIDSKSSDSHYGLEMPKLGTDICFYSSQTKELLERKNHPIERSLLGESIKNQELIYFIHQEKPLHLLVNCQKILDNEDRQWGVVMINEDITERIHLEQQLLQAQKMEVVGQLAGGIAHDFNNLLTVIGGYGNLLQSEFNDNSILNSYVQEIILASEKASTLTRQLLAFSRKQFFIAKLIDLNSIVQQLESMIRRLIPSNIVVRTKLTENLGKVKADPSQVEQIIINLVVNSRDAMADGGEIFIETTNVYFDETYVDEHPEAQTGFYAMLAISDTGTGMDANTQAKIFEPFFTTKGVGKGTGMGLAVVYGIVRQSEGLIFVYSEPGKGTTLKIYFPFCEKIDTETFVQRNTHSELCGHETILVIEDEPGVRQLLKMILENHGYSVIICASANEALEKVSAFIGEISLVISDVIMPGISSRIAIETIRERFPNIKVLFISGYTDDSIVRHGILVEQTPFMQKPFSPLSLISKVRELLNP